MHGACSGRHHAQAKVTRAGAGGQTVLIVPSQQLAIVRLGRQESANARGLTLRKAVAIVVDTVARVDKSILGLD